MCLETLKSYGIQLHRYVLQTSWFPLNFGLNKMNGCSQPFVMNKFAHTIQIELKKQCKNGCQSIRLSRPGAKFSTVGNLLNIFFLSTMFVSSHAKFHCKLNLELQNFGLITTRCILISNFDQSVLVCRFIPSIGTFYLFFHKKSISG